jgi:ORF6N domain
LLLRGHKVLLDADLAALYGVETRVLVQAVKRNLERFPDDFMFQLTWEEAQPLRSQSVILNAAVGQDDAESPPASRSQTVSLKRGANVKYRPYAFTEQGVAMLSSVLRSPQAIAVNIDVMRAFVRLREVLAGNKELSATLAAMEQKMELLSLQHETFAGNTRAQFKQVFEALRQLMTPPPEPKKRPIGFVTLEEKPGKPTAKRKT